MNTRTSRVVCFLLNTSNHAYTATLSNRQPLPRFDDLKTVVSQKNLGTVFPSTENNNQKTMNDVLLARGHLCNLLLEGHLVQLSQLCLIVQIDAVKHR